jgi:hypothetical protein
MDRNGKKPKKTPAVAPHSERSDAKAHSRDETANVEWSAALERSAGSAERSLPAGR